MRLPVTAAPEHLNVMGTDWRGIVPVQFLHGLSEGQVAAVSLSSRTQELTHAGEAAEPSPPRAAYSAYVHRCHPAAHNVAASHWVFVPGQLTMSPLGQVLIGLPLAHPTLDAPPPEPDVPAAAPVPAAPPAAARDSSRGRAAARTGAARTTPGRAGAATPSARSLALGGTPAETGNHREPQRCQRQEPQVHSVEGTGARIRRQTRGLVSAQPVVPLPRHFMTG